MMSAEQVDRLSDEAAARARKKHLVPLPIGHGFAQSRERLAEHLRRLPFLGDYVPQNLRIVKRLELVLPQAISESRMSGVFGAPDAIMVDSSGLGQRDDPALTFSELVDLVDANRDFRWAIVQQGQFQAFIAAFEPITKGEQQ